MVKATDLFRKALSLYLRDENSIKEVMGKLEELLILNRENFEVSRVMASNLSGKVISFDRKKLPLLRTTDELKYELMSAFKKYGFKINSAKEMADEFIWNEKLTPIFIMQYCNTTQIKEESLDILAKNTMAKEIYKQASNLKNPRSINDSFKADGDCAGEILNNIQIVNTFAHNCGNINKYFVLCEKVAFTLSDILQHFSWIRLPKDTIWYILKNLVKDLDLSCFSDKNKLYFNLFSRLKRHSSICFSEDVVLEAVSDSLFVEGLKFLVEWYNTDFTICDTKKNS